VQRRLNFEYAGLAKSTTGCPSWPPDREIARQIQNQCMARSWLVRAASTLLPNNKIIKKQHIRKIEYSASTRMTDLEVG